VVIWQTGAVSWLPGVKTRAESYASRIGLINLDVKHAGERSAGNPHAAFDVEGAGNATRGLYILPGLARQHSTLLMRKGW